MNTRQQIKWSVFIIPALLLALLFNGAIECFASWDYGNGRHGSFILTTNTTIEQLYQAVRLTNDPPQYDPTNPNAIPNFQTLTISPSVNLTANAWNGTNGGWIALKVQGVLSITAGAGISASGIGYRGGGWTWRTGFSAGIQGESYAGSQSVTTSANYGGGGGAETIGAGGGGGYATPGQVGNFGNGGGHGGAGGGTYGTPSLDTVYLGSGGGGGNQAGGAGGGGAIVLNVGVLNVQGGIQAAGGSGGIGGAGSGGSILLSVGSASLGTNQVFAVGGNGSAGWGGNGGDGRIAVRYAETCSGLTVPSAYTFNDTNSDSIQITNQPTSQTNFLGDSVLFAVGFTTISPYALQWYFDGVIIPPATNQTLSIPHLSLTNQGFYWLVISNTVMTITNSPLYLTVLDTNNAFGDGIPNWWKTRYGLSLTDPTLGTNHPPGDQLTYQQKYLYLLNPTNTDSDGDGLSDYAEIFRYHSNPLSTNTAGDGIPDGWKVQYGLNPSANDANNQVGATGVTYLQVYQYDTTHTNQVDPRNPFFAPDTSIYEALNNGQHTNRFYYDHEDRLIGAEYSRGVSIAYQYDGNGNLTRQTVLSRATETNGLPVLWLWLNGLTNQPGIAYQNPSGNGWNNYQDWLAGTNPTNSQSIPSLLNNPGSNIATLTVPFALSNWVIANGNLNGIPGDEVFVGADGNAAGKNNSLFLLSQGAFAWQVQQLPVGPLGITSIAIGQPTNCPFPAIYVGLRHIGGTGAIWQLFQTNGLWQTNVLAVSTNEAAYVLGVRSADVLGSFSTNGLDAALYSLAFSGGAWNQTILSTNGSHRGLGVHETVFSKYAEDSSVRLLDSGGIQVIGGTTQFYTDNILLPQGLIQNPGTGKWHFLTPSAMSWTAAEAYFTNFHGNLTLPASAAENNWISSSFSGESWIGLYWAQSGWAYPFYANGNPAPTYGGINTYTGYAQFLGYANWYSGQPSAINRGGFLPWTTINFVTAGLWGVEPGPLSGIGELSDPVEIFTNQWLIPEPPATNRFSWRGLSLVVGLPRPNQTNSTSIFYAFADDQNLSGQLDAGDAFTLAEYVVSGNTWTTNTLLQIPITSLNAAQSFALAAVNFTGSGNDTLFTGEPDGRVYSWTAADSATPLQRQLFSDAYAGKAWQAMCGVQMPAFGKGLVALMVDPTNQSACNVIFWPPQALLPTPQPSLIETAPTAVPIPSASPLGVMASLTVRLWSAEGDSSTPFIQYQLAGTTNWQNATLTILDGAAYTPALRVSALPTGVNHTLVWNTLADLGSVSTNIVLRARAQDFMLVGDWSVPVPYQLNTLPPFQINFGSTNLQMTTNGFQIQISGLNGTGPVIIYASTNLIDWIPIFTNPPSMGSFPFIDPAATNLPGRFYKASEQ
jgi:YD repeat-containing protein